MVWILWHDNLPICNHGSIVLAIQLRKFELLNLTRAQANTMLQTQCFAQHLVVYSNIILIKCSPGIDCFTCIKIVSRHLYPDCIQYPGLNPDTLSEANFPDQISVWRKPAGPPHLVERIDQLRGLRAWGEWARRHPLRLFLKSRMHSWTPEDTYCTVVWVTVWGQIHSSMRTPILRLAAILQHWKECMHSCTPGPPKHFYAYASQLYLCMLVFRRL